MREDYVLAGALMVVGIALVLATRAGLLDPYVLPMAFPVFLLAAGICVLALGVKK